MEGKRKNKALEALETQGRPMLKGWRKKGVPFAIEKSEVD
jgi:hypothetical protein